MTAATRTAAAAAPIAAASAARTSASQSPRQIAAARRLEEQQLLRAALGGDDSAWQSFCARYDGFIAGCVVRVLRRYNISLTTEDLGDLVSEVWIALLRDDRRKLRLYDPSRGCSVSSWVGLIATNTIIDYLRVKYTANAYLEDSPQVASTLVERRGPDTQLELRELADIARAALACLRPDEQRFVSYCYHEERNPADIAAELGISVNTVHSRKFKLRQKLIRIVDEMQANRAAA
ncbi:MAG: sigma-70 family RNA polymerase sigma factor [Myxococcales bacterium]|nr:sigma-70 family RNA polymerase sigma factor [Myxococcales bacterium]